MWYLMSRTLLQVYFHETELETISIEGSDAITYLIRIVKYASTVVTFEK